MFAYFRLPISPRELAKRTVHEIVDDNCFGMAAQLAFYFFLSLFPTLLFLVSLIGFLPIRSALDELLKGLGTIAPSDVTALLRDQLSSLSKAGNATARILTFGMLGALWSSSTAMTAIIDTVNQAYDIEETRPWWKTRLLATALTIGLSVCIVISLGLVVIGPAAARWIGNRLSMGDTFVFFWLWLRWPLILLLVVLAMDLVYHYGPDAESIWVWLTPGSLLATLLWIAASLVFRFYVARFATYEVTYGAIGGVIVLLLWFYVSGFTILIGAELNSEIDHALAGHGTDRQPNGKKRIGAALERAIKEGR